MTETEIAKIVVDVVFQVHKRFRAMAMAFGKSVEKVVPVHKKQLSAYMRLADKRLGLLINLG